jgi:hypothetical protein
MKIANLGRVGVPFAKFRVKYVGTGGNDAGGLSTETGVGSRIATVIGSLVGWLEVSMIITCLLLCVGLLLASAAVRTDQFD